MFIDYLDTPLGLFEFMATEDGIFQAIFCGDKESAGQQAQSKVKRKTDNFIIRKVIHFLLKYKSTANSVN